MGFINRKEWKLATLIQFGILLIISATCILTYCNIKQQGEFNRNSLRPFVYAIPNKEMRIEDNSVLYNYALHGSGRTPAYSIRSYSTLSEKKIFPMEVVERIVKDSLSHPRSFIFPGQSGISKGQSVLLLSDINEFLKLDTIYIHCFFSYLDFDGNPYYFRTTFASLSFNRLGNRIYCDWAIIDASEKPF